jgi:hypothetical protein
MKLGELDDEMRAILGAARSLLHSHRLVLPHPRAPERSIEIEAPMPADMSAVLAAERALARNGA